MIFLFIKSYLLGSIPFAYIFSRLNKHIDIRRIGSKNVGTTNVFKEVGVVPGILTALGDAGKGLMAVLSTGPTGSGGEYIALLLAMVGHNWSIWLGFQGGGGLATFIGGMLIISKWWVVLILLAIWGMAYLVVREHNRSAVVACYFAPIVLGLVHSSWAHFSFGVGAALVVGLKRLSFIKNPV